MQSQFCSIAFPHAPLIIFWYYYTLYGSISLENPNGFFHKEIGSVYSVLTRNRNKRPGNISQSICLSRNNERFACTGTLIKLLKPFNIVITQKISSSMKCTDKTHWTTVELSLEIWYFGLHNTSPAKSWQMLLLPLELMYTESFSSLSLKVLTVQKYFKKMLPATTVWYL